MFTSVKSAPVTPNAAVLWFYRGRRDIFEHLPKRSYTEVTDIDVKHITSNTDRKALQDIIPVT